MVFEAFAWSERILTTQPLTKIAKVYLEWKSAWSLAVTLFHDVVHRSAQKPEPIDLT
jgi:hypothetical protein